MADLTGKTIASTYKDLLQVSNSNDGIDGTLRVIEDGEGTESILSISSSALKVGTSSQLQFRDSAIHISSDADGYLNVQADTGININIGGTDELAVTSTTSTFGTNLVIPDSGTIGNASDTDLLTFTSGVLTVAGELDATTLDISGNADIDGTLEADAITVDGVALATFIRDTVGTNMLSSNTESGITVTYDTSNDNIDFSIDAAQTTITSLLATDIKIGEDDQTKIDFETANEIHFYADNAEQVYVADGIFGPQTDADVDLGASGVEFKDLYIDGTAHIDTLDVDVANTFSATKHAPNTSGTQAITLTADTPFHTVCSDVATVSPTAAKTVTLTLPAWSEGLYLRIVCKCIGFFIGPVAAKIVLKPASGEYLNGAQDADYLLLEDADGGTGGTYGIAHVFATVEYADGESSGGTTINTWIVDDTSDVGRTI